MSEDFKSWGALVAQFVYFVTLDLGSYVFVWTPTLGIELTKKKKFN